MVEGRLYLYVAPTEGGGARVTITRDYPVHAAGAAVIRSRGTIQGERLVLDIPSSAFTADQITVAVSAYLTTHPPAPARPPTSAEIAAAVNAYFLATPPLSKVEFTVTLADAYAVGLSAGGAEKRLPCAGVKTTDALTVQATTALPSGYGGLCVGCTENGFVRIGFVRPLLALGANNLIPMRITAFR